LSPALHHTKASNERWVYPLEIVLPYSDYRKALCPEYPRHAPIPPSIAFEFAYPIESVIGWSPTMPWAAVPKAPVGEDCKPERRNDEVGSAGQSAARRDSATRKCLA
jgi:hypothetical protein